MILVIFNMANCTASQLNTRAFTMKFMWRDGEKNESIAFYIAFEFIHTSGNGEMNLCESVSSLLNYLFVPVIPNNLSCFYVGIYEMKIIDSSTICETVRRCPLKTAIIYALHISM